MPVLKKDQIQIQLHVDVHQIRNVVIIDAQGLFYPLRAVQPDDMAKLWKEKPTIGRPELFSLVGDKITFYPRPDRDYERLRVEYLPAPQFLGEVTEEDGPTESSFGRKRNKKNDR